MELAELLWTLESESVAAALFAANLLRCMAALTDIISDKHELERWADIFEKKAEGVVEECFKENPEYTRENLIRELDYYGHLTYLELASDGNSIKFIAHRSVQELLDYVWRNTLDNTTRPFQFILYLICGIICPFIIPFTVQYKSKNYLPENQKEEFKMKLHETEYNSLSVSETSDSRIFDKSNAVSKKTKFSSFYIKMYFKKLFDFYETPIIKFSYTIISYVIFLIYFAFLNLTGFHVQNLNTSYYFIFILLIIWTISLGFEEIRQAFASGVSFKAYISDLWNIIDILAHSFFLIGTFAINMTLADPLARLLLFSILDVSPMLSISNTLIRLSKFMYGFSIFLFCVRILQYFSFNVNMGPIIVMIKNMLANDLGPFMTILMAFLVSYGILLWSISFEVKNNLNASEVPILLYEMFRTAYFQLFGDLRMDYLRNESQFSQCGTQSLMCADAWGIWLGPVVAAVYLVLSSVLMLNLLIAIFSNTYDIVQSSATEYWTMERYNLMRQSSQKPSVAPPIIILWQIYFFLAKLFSIKTEGKNPFRTCYTDLPMKEKQLVQWEHLRAIDYMRCFDENSKKNRDKTTFVVNKRGPSIGSIGGVKKDLELIRTEIMENVKEKMAYIDNRMQRLDIIDNNVIEIIDLLRNIEITSEHTNSLIDQKIKSNQRKIHAGAKLENQLWKSNNSAGAKLENQLWKSNKKYFKLWGAKIENHIILRIVPLINFNMISKNEFINEFDENSIEEEWRKNESIKNLIIPVNPYEVSNKIGNDSLPSWGINNCMHILISRWNRDERGNIRKIFNKPILQVLGITQNSSLEIPFIIVQHHNSCLTESCSMDLLMGIFKKYINRISTKNSEKKILLEKNLSALNAATINEIHRGYIEDLRNTDNSWMETVAFNIHQIYNLEFSHDFLKVLEHDKSERVDWIDALEPQWKNPSNRKLLRELTNLYNANF